MSSHLDQHDEIASPAAVSADEASRALLPYLLTEEEAGGLISGTNDASHKSDRDNSRNSVADPLCLPSGSITYDLYRWHQSSMSHSDETVDSTQLGPEQALLYPGRRPHSRRRHGHSRSASIAECSVVQSELGRELVQSHSQLNMPGGFRRHYVHQRAADEGRATSVLTASFVDFLALFGHFAGGDFPSDEDDDEEDEDNTGQSIYGGTDSGIRRRLIPGSSADQLDSLRAAATGSSPRGTLVQPVQMEPTDMTAANSTSRGASVKKTFFLLIKSFVGGGVLFLPRAFHNGGLLFSSVLMLVVAAVSLYTMLLLVKCYERVHCGYGEMGRRLFGKWMERVVLGSILISQIGFSCASAIFVATNMRDLFNAVTGCRYRLGLGFWVVAQMAVLLPLCLVRHIKGFSAIALLADVFVVIGLVYVWGVDVSTLSRLGMSYVRNFNPENYSLFLGTAAYTFEGYALILPIVDAMGQPAKFPAVLSLVMAICATIAVSIGALSYAAFGERTEAIVLLNMPSNTAPTLAVQLLYSSAILFTIPLMMFPVIRIFEQALFPRRSGKLNTGVKLQKNLFRALLVVVVIGISVANVERVDKLVSVIGGFACVPLSFIFPPLFHLKAVAESRWERTRDAALAGLGMVICLYVTYGAVSRWGAGEPPYDFCDRDASRLLVDQVVAGLNDLGRHIPFVLSSRCGETVTTRGKQYTHALVVELEKGDQLSSYADHPAHLAVLSDIKKIISEDTIAMDFDSPN
ncbi:hypothetical protein GGI19_005553 [Coemansia pectinata]|uniref:Stress-response A/B barrel domain-containing protein n=1 Tax=Coemansia pectinata TaxID=1052879 RepID=A0A9W8GW65_9FUNG|nr:hypothetical protein GGI19_005553 [Coemansia pectinata]